MRNYLGLVLFVVACGGDGGGSTDIGTDMKIADRTDIEISRMINAAGGTDGFAAQNAILRYEDPFGDPITCPTVTIDQAKKSVTLTGGCTTPEGFMVVGRAVATNVDWGQELEADFGDSEVYELENFGEMGGQAGSEQLFDGRVEVSGAHTTYDMDVTATLFGGTMRSDIYTECSGGASAANCTISGSGIEIPGVGGAHVSGTIKATRSGDVVMQTTKITIKGQDTLTYELTSDGQRNCQKWSISGAPERGMNTCP